MSKVTKDYKSIDLDFQKTNVVSLNINSDQYINSRNIPICKILDVNIAAINMDWCLNYIKNNINELSGEYVCVSNVHTTVMSYENADYKKIQNEAVMALPDGGPLSSIGRLRGYNQMERVTGPSLMEEIFNISVENSYRHFFYGSSEETLKKMSENLKYKFPGIEIVGLYSPPYRNLSPEEDVEIVKIINNSAPDFLWVGLGAPKQEKWMASHRGKVKGLMVGVGAGFDYSADNIKRAPLWMQKSNLEWLYRLLQDPKRLFIRYFETNTKFIWYILLGKNKR